MDPLEELVDDLESDDDAEVSDDGMEKFEAFMSGAVNAKMNLNVNKAINVAQIQLAKKLSSANRAQMDQQKAHMQEQIYEKGYTASDETLQVASAEQIEEWKQ